MARNIGLDLIHNQASVSEICPGKICQDVYC